MSEEILHRGRRLLPKRPLFKICKVAELRSTLRSNSDAASRFPVVRDERDLTKLRDDIQWYAAQYSGFARVHLDSHTADDMAEIQVNLSFVNDIVSRLPASIRREYFTFHKPLFLVEFLGCLDLAMEENKVDRLEY